MLPNRRAFTRLSVVVYTNHLSGFANRAHWALPIIVVATLIQAGCATKNAPDATGNGANLPTQTAAGGSANRRHATASTPALALKLCKTGISNSPPSSNRQVSRGSATGCLNGVALNVAPAPKACLTSGFGLRRSRLHKGVDYQSKPAGAVIAAAAGVVVSREYRQKDFGHWIVLDHGAGVFSSYAHLASVESQIQTRARVKAGQILGLMGRSGNATNSIHLHYEIRHGDLGQVGSYFKLQPVDPFSLPAQCLN